MGVTAAVELGGALTLGLDGAALGLGGALTLWLAETLALRLGEKLAIALETGPPQPAVRHPARIAVMRKRP